MVLFDLSQYALSAFVGIIVTITSIAGFNPILSIVIALIIGLVIGSIIV